MATTSKASDFVNNIKVKIFDKYADDTSASLVATTSIGWILASTANTCGIIFNKKNSNKDKKFLIPQEIADCVLNIGLFVLLTNKLTKFGKKLVDKGTIGSEFIKDAEEKLKFKNGVATLASLIGVVVASNIITPIIRKKIGSAVQNKSISKRDINLNVSKSQIPFNSRYNNPVSMKNFVAFTKNRGNLKI